MDITIIPHPYKRQVFLLELEGRPWKEIHAAIFGKSPDLESFKEPLEPSFLDLEFRFAKNFALRRLARKNYSSFEMEKLLYEHLVSKQTVQAIIDKFTSEKMIDDQDWLASFLRRQQEKKVGGKRIMMKMREKGVPENQIEEAFKETKSEADTIRKLLQTKYASFDLSDYREKQKVIGGLIRRGFNYEEISEQISGINNRYQDQDDA